MSGGFRNSGADASEPLLIKIKQYFCIHVIKSIEFICRRIEAGGITSFGLQKEVWGGGKVRTKEDATIAKKLPQCDPHEWRWTDPASSSATERLLLFQHPDIPGHWSRHPAPCDGVNGEFQFKAATGNLNSTRQCFFHGKSLMSATLLLVGSTGVAPFRPE